MYKTELLIIRLIFHFFLHLKLAIITIHLTIYMDHKIAMKAGGISLNRFLSSFYLVYYNNDKICHILTSFARLFQNFTTFSVSSRDLVVISLLSPFLV